jgi:3-hydroxyacyl-CoA dehydrogenase
MQQVGVLGGGLMGTGIAESVARAGRQVRLFEPLDASRPTSRARLEASVARAEKAGKLTRGEAESVLERVRYVEQLADLDGSDLVIEAVVEDRDRCGHPMGPLVLCDFIGLDVLYAICDSLYEEFKRPEYAPPPLLKRMLAAPGWLGKKSGRGFYDHRAREGSGQLRLSAVPAQA